MADKEDYDMPDAPVYDEATPAPAAPAPTVWADLSLRFSSFFFRYPVHPLPHLIASMIDRRDYVMPDVPMSDAAVPATTVPASTAPAVTGLDLTVLGPTVPAAVVSTAAMPVDAAPSGAVPAVAVPAVGPRYQASIDFVPPPPREKIITQYALVRDKPLPILTVTPNMRKEHNLNDFRYLKGSVIKSFMNHRVKEMVAKEAIQLENRVSNHILMLRGQGLDRMEAADAGIELFQTSLKEVEERFVNDEMITLRNDNFELTRENRMREQDFQKMTRYNEEVVEKCTKMQYRARLAERQLFDIHDSAATKQVQREFRRAARKGYEEWLTLQANIPSAPGAARATRSASQNRKNASGAGRQGEGQ